MKPVTFCGSSQKAMRDFPDTARHEAGVQIMKVQMGGEPDDWKPMQDIGPGVREIRIHSGGQYRVICVAKFAGAVHVLHAFQKKTQKTLKKDIELARKRYREIIGG